MVDSTNELNTVFWDEAPAMLEQGAVISMYRENPFTIQSGFYVRLSTRKTTKIVIDKRAEAVRPMQVDSLEIFNLIATKTMLSEIQLPLIADNKAQNKAKLAFVGMKKPNPRIRWTLRVGQDVVMGDRSSVLGFGRLDEALGRAAHMGAQRATIRIPESVRLLFQSREVRNNLIGTALARRNLKVRSWCEQEGLNYYSVNKVINRADDDYEIKDKLSNLTGHTVSELWPEIDWSDLQPAP